MRSCFDCSEGGYLQLSKLFVEFRRNALFVSKVLDGLVIHQTIKALSESTPHMAHIDLLFVIDLSSEELSQGEICPHKQKRQERKEKPIKKIQQTHNEEHIEDNRQNACEQRVKKITES